MVNKADSSGHGKANPVLSTEEITIQGISVIKIA